MILAVGYLHEKGILHRDLKLENILIDEDGYLKIIDFGLSKKLKPNQKTSTMVGTSFYKAPEIVLGKNHDKNVDWWSVGICLYALLTYRFPFMDDDKKKQDSMITSGKYTWDPKFDISDTLKDLVARLLQTNVKKRLGSTNDYKEVLSHKFFKGIDI